MLTLIDDNLAIRRAKPRDVITIGRILAPDNLHALTLEGTVIAVGPGLRNKRGVRIPVEVQVGDYVYFKQYEGNDVKAEGQDLLIIREVYVLGVAIPEGGDGLFERLFQRTSKSTVNRPYKVTRS